MAPGDDGSGFGSEKAVRDRVLGRLREAMRPEFLNRIDEIVLFRKLDAAQLRRIVRLLLTDTAARLASRHTDLTVSEAAVDLIAERGYQPEYGARPLRRVIQRDVEDAIADLMVTRDLEEGDTVAVDAVDGEIVATLEQHAAALAA